MGTADYHLGDFPAAEQYLRRAMSLDPGSPRQYLDLAMICYRTGRLAEAVQLLRRATPLIPREKAITSPWALVLMDQHDYH